MDRSFWQPRTLQVNDLMKIPELAIQPHYSTQGGKRPGFTESDWTCRGRFATEKSSYGSMVLVGMFLWGESVLAGSFAGGAGSNFG